MKVLKKFGLVYLLAVFLCTSMLTLVYCIPNEAIAENVHESKQTLKQEMSSEFYRMNPYFISNVSLSNLDSSTARLMIASLIQKDPFQSPFRAAMDMNGYSYYWQGYQIFLRPLMLIANLDLVRYINMLVFCAAFALASAGMCKATGTGAAVSLGIAVAAVGGTFMPMSLPYIGCFFLAFFGAAIMAFRYEKMSCINVALTFFIIGMCESYFNMFSLPVITVGFPLLTVLLLRRKGAEPVTLRSELHCMGMLSVSWASGYGLLWAAKWPIADFALHRGVIKKALYEVGYRMAGNPLKEVGIAGIDRGEVLRENIIRLIPAELPNWFGWALLLLLAGTILYFALSRKMKYGAASCIPILLVGLYPYAWYLVVANHSLVHCWMSYRIQSVTIFAVLLLLTQWHGGIPRQKNPRTQK